MEPLKNKHASMAEILESEFCCFQQKDILSAVEWLKKEISWGYKNTPERIDWLNKQIDLAFEDVVKSKEVTSSFVDKTSSSLDTKTNFVELWKTAIRENWSFNWHVYGKFKEVLE